MIPIREYQPSDRKQLHGLIWELHETLRPLDGDLAPGDQIIDAYVERLLTVSSHTHGAVFVAEHEGRLVGYACLFGQVSPEEPDEIDRPYSYLADLYVGPDFRRQGVGARLLEKAEEYAQRLGVPKIELKVLAAHQQARRFYEQHGYTDRIVVMAKRVSPPSSEAGGPPAVVFCRSHRDA